MEKIAFVILHYNNIKDTEECVQSILNITGRYDCNIVIVDNASPNKTGSVLQEKYATNGISIILLHENLGFARGNNIGYEYAKKKFDPDFIIILNNDIIIKQLDFIDQMILRYQETGFFVAGPDIINQQGKHGNPHRNEMLTIQHVKRIIRNRRIILLYIWLKKIFHLENKLKILEKWDYRNEQREKSNINYKLEQEGIVLQGSFLIFSNAFIKKNEVAFYPNTFMYLEEEILSYICYMKKYKMVYLPQLCVLHKEEASTNESVKCASKYEFFSRNLKYSAEQLYKLMNRR